MAVGFSERFDFGPLVGWELYQVTIDKYHVMFWFEGGLALLNIADRFSYRSGDAIINFSYEIYGDHKFLNIDTVLREKVVQVNVITKDQLDLVFENGGILSIYDNPEFKSWWFIDGRKIDVIRKLNVGDIDPEDMTEAETQARCQMS